jgi:hypothetical protein
VTGSDEDGYGIAYGNVTALLVNAVKEVNMNIKDFVDAPLADETGNNTFIGNFFSRIATWLSDTGNGIGTVVAGVFKSERVETRELCIEDVCVTKEELQALLMTRGYVAGGNESGTDNVVPVEESVLEEETSISIGEVSDQEAQDETNENNNEIIDSFGVVTQYEDFGTVSDVQSYGEEELFDSITSGEPAEDMIGSEEHVATDDTLSDADAGTNEPLVQ